MKKTGIMTFLALFCCLFGIGIRDVRADGCCPSDAATIVNAINAGFQTQNALLQGGFAALGIQTDASAGQNAAAQQGMNSALAKLLVEQLITMMESKRKIDAEGEAIRQQADQSKLMDNDQIKDANMDPRCPGGTAQSAAGQGMAEVARFLLELEQLHYLYLLAQGETTEIQEKEQVAMSKEAKKIVFTNPVYTDEQANAFLAALRLLLPQPAMKRPKNLDENSAEGKNYLIAESRAIVGNQLASVPWNRYLAERYPSIKAEYVLESMNAYGLKPATSIKYEIDKKTGQVSYSPTTGISKTEFAAATKAGKEIKEIGKDDMISIESYWDMVRQKYMSNAFLIKLNEDKNEIGAIKETVRLLSENNVLLMDIRQSLRYLELAFSMQVNNSTGMSTSIQTQNKLGVTMPK